jgi:hypothetical protein
MRTARTPAWKVGEGVRTEPLAGCFRSERLSPRTIDYSSGIFAAFTTLSHFAISE